MKLNRWLLEYELDQMSRYLDLMQNSLQQRYKELEASYEEDMAREMDEDEETILEDQYLDDFIEATEEMPRLLLSSFTIAWYSFVEQKLLDFCEKLRLSIVVTPKDSRTLDKGIRRARKFLLEGRNYEIDKSHWQELSDIGRLRNQIVHEGNRLPATYIEPEGKSFKFIDTEGETYYILADEDLFQYLKKHNMINQMGVLSRISPSFEYCEYLIDFGKRLFLKLYTDLEVPYLPKSK
jgi:hypothetical protein